MFFDNYLDTMILSSSEKAQQIVKAFKKYIEAGEDPNLCQQDVYRECGVYNLNAEILESDQHWIKTQVEKMYEHYSLYGSY